ncbi:MAG TPA: signal peptidase I [Dehalococcoidia bacterium]|nr:signal peptidase I [Dehalococcoidia bacterium]
MRRKSSRHLLRIISTFPGLYSLLAGLCARRVRVDGWSMAPTLQPGEYALFDRLAYHRDRPRTGDIALIQIPDRDLRLIKRIIAVPGDNVKSRVLERNEYWVEGDNADGSTDSRHFGAVRRRHLLAKGWLLYWPSSRWRTLQ